MKTLKILLYILLALTVFVMTGALLVYLVVPEIRENLTLDAYSISQKIIDKHTILVAIELAVMIVCSLASLISTIVNWKKPHGGYFAGALLSVPYILSVVLVSSAKDILVCLEKNYYNFYPVFRYAHVLMLKILAWVLFVTMAALLLDGFLQTRRYKREMNKAPASKSATTSQFVPSVTAATPSAAAAELKQYKELLDMGAITQEEFDAKKKQLLDLPNTYRTPAALQSVGKCVVCGRENVSVESIEVIVAGMSRKRTMCAQCAAKYK